MKSLIRIVALAVVLILVLGGCARGTDDLREWVQDVQREPAEPIEPIPPMRTAEVVTYEAADLRDPFRIPGRRPAEEEDLVMEAEDGGLRPDPDRRREYLEEFPLDTLAMVGTLEIENVLYALIRDNENVVHRVREGDYMGQNHGEVIGIESNRVNLRELVQDARGGWMERHVRVAMAEQ